ncbi:hypothetical protein [Siphonobacter aquaeclarae]|uniref:Uncharacterized protein n=1 Tax=Siphonobacter aquaeclarae TaxID=563176 RepID=A0A1G9T9A7_9BACT|nr:hypothetical protein [Siphonobacter aquaeclarae]SDM44224.1 hypothetical protein SAMN04488090_3466 [Siphonobacter aquaeclarae]
MFDWYVEQQINRTPVFQFKEGRPEVGIDRKEIGGPGNGLNNGSADNLPYDWKTDERIYHKTVPDLIRKLNDEIQSLVSYINKKARDLNKKDIISKIGRIVSSVTSAITDVLSKIPGVGDLAGLLGTISQTQVAITDAATEAAANKDVEAIVKAKDAILVRQFVLQIVSEPGFSIDWNKYTLATGFDFFDTENYPATVQELQNTLGLNTQTTNSNSKMGIVIIAIILLLLIMRN